MDNHKQANAIDTIIFQSIPGIYNRTIKKYYDKNSNLAPGKWIADLIAEGRLTKAVALEKKEFAEKTLALAEKKNISWCTLWDLAYPESLLQIYDPPAILFFKGKLPQPPETAVCIVGTRNPREQSLLWTKAVVDYFAHSQTQILSGLARGVDTAAHKSSLRNKLTTFAVLGSGLNHIYPKENEQLAAEIIEKGGGLISEFLPEVTPERFRFPQRNRILSGLCTYLILIEAAEKSGALGTCKWALEHGKEIWVMTPLFNSKNYLGNARLLREGANLLASVEDLDGNQGLLQKKLTLNGDISNIAHHIIKNIPEKGIHREELGHILEFSAGQLELLLFDLIEKGLILEGKGNFLYPGMP